MRPKQYSKTVYHELLVTRASKWFEVIRSLYFKHRSGVLGENIWREYELANGALYDMRGHLVGRVWRTGAEFFASGRTVLRAMRGAQRLLGRPTNGRIR